MFAKKIKFAIAATTLSLSFTQPSFAVPSFDDKNVYDSFYITVGDVPILEVWARVLTVEGLSKRVNTWWSGRNNNANTSITQGGDGVEWSYFYVDENQTTWGSPNNPDLYIKVWLDRSGRIDVNCFHVSVPDILCGAYLLDANKKAIENSRAAGIATTNKRFVQLRKEPNSNSFHWVDSWYDDCLWMSRLNSPEEKIFDEQFKTIEVASNQ